VPAPRTTHVKSKNSIRRFCFLGPLDGGCFYISNTQGQAAKKVRGVGYTPIYMSSKYGLGVMCLRVKSLIMLRKVAFRFT
jgi:hypothetical protein